MTRIRTDTVFGTTTNAPLTAAGTTLNSAGLANLAAVSSAEAIIVLDPNRVAGAPEIVVVTAHTAAATSATIQRGQFGTSARQHEVGTEWVHGPIAGNATTYATAADDQSDYVPMNAWEDYVPTLTQSATVTKTVGYAKYQRIGRTIHVQVFLTITSAGTPANAVRVGLPVAASSLEAVNGVFRYLDSGTAVYAGTAHGVTTSAVVLTVSGSGDLGVAPAVTAANTDTIHFAAVYEAAS